MGKMKQRLIDRADGLDAQGWEQVDAKAYLAEYRNEVLDEVAQEIERFTFAFGVDTVQSFAAFVRGMKS